MWWCQEDLLPKGTSLEDVAQWLERAATHKKLNPVATFVVSSRTRAQTYPLPAVPLRISSGVSRQANTQWAMKAARR